jgi:hypothetical protein
MPLALFTPVANKLYVYFSSEISKCMTVALYCEPGCTYISSAVLLKEVLDEEVIPRKAREGGRRSRVLACSHFELAKISRWFIARRKLRIIKSGIKTRHTQFN